MRKTCKFHRKTPVVESLFIKVVGIQASNFLRRDFITGGFLWNLRNFEEHLRTTASKNSLYNSLNVNVSHYGYVTENEWTYLAVFRFTFNLLFKKYPCRSKQTSEVKTLEKVIHLIFIWMNRMNIHHVFSSYIKSIRYNVNTFPHDSMWDDFLIYQFTLETIIYLLTCVWSQKSDKLIKQSK